MFRTSFFPHPPTWTSIFRRSIHGIPASIPLPPKVPRLDNKLDIDEARTWIAKFKSMGSVPLKGAVQMTFSRSSGPGGQNVNKVSTKATLRCAVDSPFIPLWARDELTKSPYYASSSKSILITSTLTRSQSQNVDDCLTKLHNLLLAASNAPIKNEPTQAQRDRVTKLEKASALKRRADKSYRSSVKKARSSKGGGGWD